MKNPNEPYCSTLTLTQAAGRLADSKHLLMTTHAKPDGDAYGSVMALALAMKALGKQVDVRLMPPMPAGFASLPGQALVQWHDPQESFPDLDMVLVVDTGAWSQVSPMRPLLEPMADRMLVIDHHLHGDIPSAHRLIDSRAAACAQIIAELIDVLESSRSNGLATLWTLDICRLLYVGLASDTGWFRFSNTQPQTHRWAARLQEAGVDHADLYRILEQSERPEKLALTIRALDSLELLDQQRVAVMVLKQSDFAQTGAWMEETERLVDLPQAVSTVQVVVLICEPSASSRQDAGPGEKIRVSFRSKPGPQAVDVAKMAQQFGGGGHARAAGAKIAGSLADVVAKVKKAILEKPI